MAKINNEMRTLLEETDLWVLATADSNGIPNAVPILFVKLMDNNSLLLVDNFMKKTVDNIGINPNVAISVWKDLTGYQFKGKAKIETSGPNFETGKKVKKVVQAKEPKLTPKGIVLVDIDSIYITSPGPDAGNKVR
ncbi:MAG: pyridoxamine 5'-phosphate oxidase family protein [Deltaproteobacteria bacterium]|nr:pyridoxamine 5'-phosphate oxidase family protein [Deltaproteobacteria bacterium]